MNDFDKQKQEIKKLIVKTFFNVAGLASKENKQELFDAVDNLQPPKLTCSTCKTKQFDRIGEPGYCSNYSSPLAGLTLTDKIANEASCTHHSAYGDKDENN